jgi:hypothetical protein
MREQRFSKSAFDADCCVNGHAISSHALLLEVDLRRAYVAGAWISVIILSCAAVEAHVRQVKANDYASPANQLFANDDDLQWLREMRNEIAHAGEPGSRSKLWKVAGADFRANQEALEPEATRAVEIMFRAIYGKKVPS